MGCSVCGRETKHTYSFYIGEGQKTSTYNAGVTTKSNIYTNVQEMQSALVCRKCAFQLRTILLVSILPLIYGTLLAVGLWRFGNWQDMLANFGMFFFVVITVAVAFCLLIIVLSIREYVKDERNEEGGAQRLIRKYKKDQRGNIKPGTVFFTPPQWQKIVRN